MAGMKKSFTYKDLQTQNKQLNSELQKLKRELGLLKKSFLPEDNFYKDRYYRITENVNDIIYRMTMPDAKYEYISPQVENLFGYKPSSFYNSGFFIRHIIHPDFFQLFKQNWKRLKKGKVPAYSEIKILKKNGEECWIQQKNLMIKDNSGKPVAIEGIVTDITNRKKAEEALFESENLKNSIFNNLPHLAWLKDIRGVYQMVNESFARSVGKSVDEVIGKTDKELYDNKMVEKYIYEDKEIIRLKKQLFFQEKTGDKWWETFKAPIFNNDGVVTGIMGISLEISGRKKIEEDIKEYSEKLATQNVKLKLINDELKLAKEKAEESDKLKSAFLANMSHEIRTPMNAILGFATLLKNRKLTTEKRNNFIDLINTNSRQLLHIISDIIDISKIEADQISIFNKNFELNKMLQEMYTVYVTQIKNDKKEIKLKLNTGLKDESSTIYTDKVRLEQILSNLLSNAIKFTEYGTIEYGYILDKKASELEFFVRDTGIGMTASEQKVIFDRFRQVSTSYNKMYGGTGLGLSISKGLTEKLGGNIWLESEIDKGSVFYFSIPYKPGTRVDKLPKIQYDTNFKWVGKTILIAEDEDINYNLLETIIKPTGAVIIRAKTGQEAVDVCLGNKKIHIVLMDIKMPDMNGLEATKKIKNIHKNLPVIAQTAYAMSTDEDNCLRAGCDAYLSKPLKVEEILSVINQYLEPASKMGASKKPKVTQSN